MEKTFILIGDLPSSKPSLIDLIQEFQPKALLHPFSESVQAIEFLQKSTTLPFMIFCNLTLPKGSGLEALDLIKRDPKLHILPVVMISPEIDETSRIELEMQGAFDFIPSTISGSDLKKIVDRHLAQALEPADLRMLDEGFADDTLDQLNQAKPLASCKDEGTVKDLYRVYHTIKGSSRSLQFPSLGIFVHQLENVLTAINKASAYAHPIIVSRIQEANGFLLKQIRNIKDNRLIEAPPERLELELKLIIANLTAGWLMGTSSESNQGPAAPIVEDSEPSESQSPSTIRITNEKLNELQSRFKKLQQIRVRMNTFSQELKSEFGDEGFPNQLLALISEMEKESTGIMEFFISLRVIPAHRLKTFTLRTAQQAADLLKKTVKIDFSAEEGLEIDQSIIEVLEAALTHLIRNSMDHGIETSEKRTSLGKPPAGLLKVQIVRESRERFILSIEDDGAGIDTAKLRSIVAQKGLLPEAEIQKLPEEKVFDFIFLDGLSTKQEVSELSGRGVGLSAVKDRIEQLGGSIHTKSTLGAGTRFEIKMPRIFQL